MYRTTIDVPDHLYQRLAAVARLMGQSLESALLETLDYALTTPEEDDARLAASIAEADRGETVSLEAIQAEDEALLDRLGITPEQRSAIRAEVEAEATAFYGV